MRFLLAAITLGAAGAGFVYLNQPISNTPTAERTALRPLLDWGDEGVDAFDRAGTLFTRQWKSTTPTSPSSAIDDFVKQHADDNTPLVEAFQVVDDLEDDDLTDTVGEVVGATSLDQLAKSDPAQPEAPPTVTETDELAAASPTLMETNSAQELVSPKPLTTSVHEATIRKAEQVDRSLADAEIAQIAAKDEVASSQARVAVKNDKPAVAAGEWKAIGKSVEGRPLHTRRYGNNGPRTLIVAGLDGEDRIAVRWIDQLSDELARRTELFQANEILIFRAVNPDGLTKKVPENSHGVLINRNFPSRRYRPLPDMSAGPGPATEAETRALLDVLYSFHPRRVIHLTATSANSSAHYNRAARDVAGDLERAYKLDVRPLDVEQFPGSLEDFADGTLEAGVLSLKLSAGKDWQQAWPKLQPLVLAAITGRVTDTMPQDELARSSPEADRTPIPVTNTEYSAKRKTRRGYEELPAPPR